MKRLLQKIYPIHTERVSIKVSNVFLFEDSSEYFFVLYANTKQYDLVGAIHYLLTKCLISRNLFVIFQV